MSLASAGGELHYAVLIVPARPLPRPIVTIELISIVSAAIVVVILWLAIRDLKPPRK